MNVSEIVSAFGAYYIAQGQNMTDLVRILRDKSVTEELFTLKVTDSDIYRASKTSIERLLQPFQKAWTPIGEVKFEPVEIRQYKMKMDHEEYPDDVRSSWLGFLEDMKLLRKDWPVIKWLIEQELLPQIKEDYELNEIYAGEYSAPTAGTAGAAGTAMNGIKKIINDYIDAGRITPITMGAFPTAVSGSKSVDYQVCEYFEDFADQINDKYWGIPMEIAVQPSRVRQFMRGYGEKYGERTDYTRNTNGDVDFTMLKLKACPSMRGSDKIWTTPKANAIRLRKETANMDRVEVEGEDRKVKIWTDFYNGVGFMIPEIVFTNDLDLTVIP